jgi:hypothetical protein
MTKSITKDYRIAAPSRREKLSCPKKNVKPFSPQPFPRSDRNPEKSDGPNQNQMQKSIDILF